MGFVQAWSKETGVEQFVPDHFFDNPVLCRGLTREDPATSAPVTAPVESPGVPEVEQPTEDWTVAQLKDYADRTGVDLAGVSKKADILASLQAPTETDKPALTAIGVANPVPDPDPAAPETPATGETQE